MTSFMLALAKEILKNTPEGISKVKFAKIIYFVYKGLVQKHLVESTSVDFIRMPLGPVPNGFMNLSQYKEFNIKEKNNNGLSYNSQIYYLNNSSVISKMGIIITDEIKLLTNQLNKFKTYELVEYSHQEPSWKNHPNGTVYYIESDDLKIKLPKKQILMGIFKNDQIVDENDRLQEQLVDGLIDDIVEESTTLEYPE